MRAIVLDYHFESTTYDSRLGGVVRKVFDSQFGQVNVLFDEDMIIDPKSRFLEQFEQCCKAYIHQILTNDTMIQLTVDLNNLLHKTCVEGYLFIGDHISFLRDRPGWIMLFGDQHFKELQDLYQGYQLEER